MKKAKSGLPTDNTPSTGSNYGLDGFDWDEHYNEGVEDAARLPEVRGLAALPDGLVGSDPVVAYPTGVENSDIERSDLNHLLKSARLPDLGWLEFNLQDLDRLPVNPVDRVIPELEDAWGVASRTDGIELIPNIDPNFLENAEPAKKTAHEDLRDIVQQAMRRSAYGEPLEEIYRNMLFRLGGDLEPVSGIWTRIQEEHGLVGNVFLRASSFPDCHKGVWNDPIRKNAADSKYLIQKTACSSCRFAENGRCSVLKKTLVEEVPWKKALSEYLPLLEASGRKAAGQGTPQEILKSAFAQEPTIPLPNTGTKPIIVAESDRISMEDARAEFAKAELQPREVVKQADKDFAKYQSKVRSQIAKWVAGGFLSQDEGVRLASSQAAPPDVIKMAMALVANRRVKSGNYSGEGVATYQRSEISVEDAWDDLKNAERKVLAEQESVKKIARKRVQARIRDMVQEGLLTQKESYKIIEASHDKTPEQMLQFAFAVIAKKSSSGIAPLPTKKVANYEGAGKDALGFVPTKKSVDLEKTKEMFSQREASLVNEHLSKLTHAGLISEEEKRKLVATELPLNDIMQYASALISNRAMERVAVPVSDKKSSQYEGQGIGAEQPRESYRKGISPKEVQAVLKYASRMMNEGSAGQELDELLRTKYSAPLLREASVKLSHLRDKHEGLAGHLYVDASTYASKSGTSGCEDGSLRHRTNSLRYVLGMDRCNSCVFRNVEGSCQKYKKTILSSVPENAGAYQQEMIRLANAPDQEVTASLFIANDFSSHFGLENSSLEGFDYADHKHDGPLQNIWFGGMEIEFGDDE